MICKIWAIKNDTKSGGRAGLQNSLDYIKDDNKTLSHDSAVVAPGTDNVSRTLEYMGNEEKTQNIYISGYLCDPDLALEQFLETKERNLARVGKTMDDDNGNVAYHIIQSFPDNLDISDEEVHQCGIEFAQKIGLYQAVICSHINPIVDKDTGEVHGACKHNHILINAHCYDPMKQFGRIDVMKYHDCKESYLQLQKYNDEIALAHHLPIIDAPELGHGKSWIEWEASRKGTSWKDQVRHDIDATKRVTNDWDTFKQYLTDAGYEIKEGKYTTYKAPEQERGVRCKSLGPDYTKEAIQRYWEERERLEREIDREINENKTTAKEKDNSYFNPHYMNVKKNRPYRISAYDSTGRRRSTVELILLLAMVIIRDQVSQFEKPDLQENNSVFGRTDWKLQNIADSIRISREENIESLDDVSKRLNETGIRIAQLKHQLKKNETSLNKMDVLSQTIETYNQVKDIVEKIQTMPECGAKEKTKDKNAELIKQYKESKEILERAKLTTPEEIAAFQDRVNKMKEIHDDLSTKLEDASESYRKYRKLNYHLEMAQQKEYVYNLDIEKTPETDKNQDRERKTSKER